MAENIIAKVNHQRYDHVFKIVFSERKELLSLYNALADTDYDNPDMLEVNTLEDAVFLGMKNDVSFIINDYQNPFEHQSTTNPNMPLRGLFYLSDLFKQMYYDRLIYTKSRINILTPRYIVFYNGIEEIEDKFELRLSESFAQKTDSPDLEVVAHVININYGHNTELYSKCKKLEEYSIFVDRVHKAIKNVPKHGQAEKLVEAIDSCIKDHVLEDILRKDRNRVMACILSQFDADKYVDGVRQESYDEGYNEGYEAAQKDHQSEIDALTDAIKDKDAELERLSVILKNHGIRRE